MTDRKLPEEFAPTGPKLSKFAIRPAPALRPRLFPDEAQFALRLAVLAGGSELAAFAAIGRALVERREPARSALLWAAFGAALLRTARPLWARLGTRLPRPLVTGVLLAAAVIPFGAWLGVPARSGAIPLPLVLLALGLPAVADLCATAIADAVTVERRAAAFSALEIGQGLGIALGLATGAAAPLLFLVAPPLALALGGVALHDLRDRGTPRSSWTLGQRWEAARTVWEPLALALFTGALGAGAIALSAGRSLFGKALPLASPIVWLVAPLVGMALASRLEARLPERALALRLCLAAAAVAFAVSPLGPDGLGAAAGLFALGGAAAALPAAVLRAAPEMDRGPASSLGFAALSLGAGLGALLALAA